MMFPLIEPHINIKKSNHYRLRLANNSMIDCYKSILTMRLRLLLENVNKNNDR